MRRAKAVKLTLDPSRQKHRLVDIELSALGTADECNGVGSRFVGFLRFLVTPVHSYPWRTFNGHLYVVGHICSTNVQKLHEVPLDDLPDNVVASLLLKVFNYKLKGKDRAIS